MPSTGKGRSKPGKERDPTEVALEAIQDALNIKPDRPKTPPTEDSKRDALAKAIATIQAKLLAHDWPAGTDLSLLATGDLRVLNDSLNKLEGSADWNSAVGKVLESLSTKVKPAVGDKVEFEIVKIAQPGTENLDADLDELKMAFLEVLLANKKLDPPEEHLSFIRERLRAALDA